VLLLLLQVALVEQLLDEVWSGPWALTVNPDWHTNTPAAYQQLVNSFEAAYSFLPIATQVGALWALAAGCCALPVITVMYACSCASRKPAY
jgi:hypothetical protein